MKVYVTKYALTAGIEVKDVDYGPSDEKYVYTTEAYRQQFVMGRTAFFSYAEAAIAACEMRDRKAASLKKQLAKVSGLIFPALMPGPTI